MLANWGAMETRADIVSITLDTNCIINLFDYRSTTATSIDSLERLFRAALSRKVELAITTRVREDLENDADEQRKLALLRTCRLFPVIGSAFRLDVSRWDAGDFLVSGEDSIMVDRLQQLLFPNSSPKQAHFTNKINDLDHLFAHAKAQRTVFVTDDKAILRKSAILKETFAIVVQSPIDLVASLGTW